MPYEFKSFPSIGIVIRGSYDVVCFHNVSYDFLMVHMVSYNSLKQNDVLMFRDVLREFWGYVLGVVWTGVWDMFGRLWGGLCEVFR